MDLQALPSPGARRLAVRVTRDAERRIRGGHPWVFDGSVESISHDGAPGDLAVVFDRSRKFVAIGLFDPTSPIRVRILHTGSPRPIDDDFWLSVLSDALDRRAPLSDSTTTTAYRLVNGESDGFPGLVVDRYGPALVVKIYSAAWLPHLRPVVGVLAELLGPEAVVLRLGRLARTDPAVQAFESAALVGELPGAPVPFVENGLRFEADLVHGQKTGYFLDQRDNRGLVGGLSTGARVLDVFSCAGGFSVHAAAGGAREVISVDQSRPALDAAVRNMELNAADPAVGNCRHQVLHGDAFAVMGQLADRGERFDLVVIDPPSFAQRNSDVGRAVAAYRKLTALGLALVNDGDWLVQASCSSRVGTDVFLGAIHDEAAAHGVRLVDTMITGHALDHPVALPEAQYLKALYGRPLR